MYTAFISSTRYQIKLIHQSYYLLVVFILAFAIYTSDANRVSDKIYSVLQSNHYCSRRLNATNQMGCTSELGGNFGVVWFVEEQSDLDHLLKDGPTPPYIAILKRKYYTRENLLQFKKNPERVSGVVFLSDDDSRARSTPFSPEDRCPNRYSGLYVNDTEYGDCKKNLWLKESQISGLLYDDIPYPIFLINDEASIEKLESCFTRNNIVIVSQKRKQDTYPLCSIQLDSFMLAASDTETCLNSRSLVDDLFQSNGQRCYFVDNHNIFAYFKPTNGSTHPSNISENQVIPDIVEPQSVVLLAAKLSSLSMFTELSPGADSTIVPIITMLAVAEALEKRRRNPEVATSNRNIAFALLDSEPFDYTGSISMVKSMQDNSFPFRFHFIKNDTYEFAVKNINIESLDYVINLDQLANYPDISKIYLHSDPSTENHYKLSRAVDVLTRTATKQNLDFKHDPHLPLPPASVQEFIKSSRAKIDPASNRLLGLVLSNYDKTYENLFYNSIYDDTHNIYQTKPENLIKHISRVASFVANSLYELAFNVTVQDVVVNETLINEMLECYLTNASCGLFTKAWQAGQKLPAEPIQTYNDPTKRSDDMNGIITHNLLSYFVGEKLDDNMTECNRKNEECPIYYYHFINGQEKPIQDSSSGLCIRSQVFLIPSRSPSFSREEERYLVDRKYPAWTVSFNSIRNPVRIFMKPSPIHQWCVFLLGLVVTVMSFMTVYHLRGSISHLRVDSDAGLHQGTST